MIVHCTHYLPDGRREAIDFERVSDVLGTHEGFIWMGLVEPDAALLCSV